MKGALDVHRALLTADVPHEVVRLRTRLGHADDLPAVLDLPAGCLTVRCYVVERTTGPSFVAALVPSGELPSPTRLLELLDACSVRPATSSEVNAATDFAAGLVCPVGLPPQVEVVADLGVSDAHTSYCALGEGGVALGIRTVDLLRTTGARSAALTGAAPSRPEQVIDLDRAAPTSPAGREGTGVDGASRRAAGAGAQGGAVRSGDVL